MIARPSDEVGRLVADAKIYAALSATFDAKEALPKSARDDEQTIIAVASQLASGCDTNPDGGEHWLLRTSERRYVLQTLAETGKLATAIEQRRSGGIDEPSEDLLRAIEGSSPFSPDEIKRDIEQPTSPERLERIIVALDRAGPIAPAASLLQNARSALAGLMRDQRRLELRERGFFGRQKEIDRLKGWLRRVNRKTPVKAAFLSGLPGIGKSALLEEMVGFAHDEYDAITVRLDFDRAGLSVLDLLGLTMEVARQIAERLGDAGKPVLEARLAAASLTVGEESFGQSRQSVFPHELAMAIGAAVRSSGRPVTMVLDTLEVLRARGELHPEQLFRWLDQLVDAGLGPLRIVAAGRGDALDSCRDRVAEMIDVGGLDDVSASQLLERLEVPARAQIAVLQTAGGNPLVLRLAAEVVQRFGADHLPKKAMDQEVAAAFLYRFLLSRIDDPLLRRLAHPGLIVRRISADLLREVIAPELDLPPLDEGEAARLFDALASQHWLVTRNPADPAFVVHRSDMRIVLLPLLYRNEALCARVNSACVSWFGARPDPASQLDVAYHRLQLMRTRKDVPFLSDAVIHQFDAALIAELPEAAQDIVLRGKGGRTSQFRASSSSASEPGDADRAGELLALLDRQDWPEGQYVVEQIVASGGFDARSLTAEAVCAFWWGAGRWNDARRVLADRDRLRRDDRDLADIPSPLVFTRFEMRAELTPARLPAMLQAFSPSEHLGRELVAPSRRLINQGAFAFFYAAREPDYFVLLERSKDVSAIAAAFEHHAGRPGRAMRQAIESSRERLLERGASPAGNDEASLAQLLAMHSPYVRLATNLATQVGYDWLQKEAAAADSRLAEAGSLFGRPLAQSPRAQPSNPIAGIASLGLFAEWIALVAFIRRDANLRTVARAAERWRRTVAGRWSYGRPPAAWQKRSRIDPVLQRRIERLHEESDPVGAARAELELWTAGQLSPAQLHRRLSAVARSAGEEATPIDRAVRLERALLPAALIPPLTILLGQKTFLSGEGS